ncbi:hypothetical protein [Pseudomonas putida]|uniref:GGDEF domain-containing protein n=1 Tax=Pseudomonas putida TaxID=303 RepID=A0A177SV80_PSEPU|nr:hypothetical protein [Pseudomonas putida]OAI94699.1 hypothetical protein AYO28_06630 [Pseudomonas putida]
MICAEFRQHDCERLRHFCILVFCPFITGLTALSPDDSLGTALGRADAALYEAKHAGKDRYVLWRDARDVI